MHAVAAGLKVLAVGLAVGVPAGTVLTSTPAAPNASPTAVSAPSFDLGAATPLEPRRFWVKDKHHYRSPWYAGSHRRMINFGCTRAPYYAPDPRCVRDRGYHHGVDLAMRCGNPLYAGVRGRVVNPRSAGALGSAYGKRAFRIRNAKRDKDIVIGHVRKVFVRPGERVERGQRLARASDAAAPDGCHLHFEVRPAKAGYTSAVDPERLLRARRTD